VTARSWTLPAAAWLAAAEAMVLIVGLALGGKPGAPMLMAFVAVKLPFCWLVTQRRPGAYLALIVWELGGALAALSASSTPLVLRLLEVATAAAVIALLVASTPLFPSVRLPGPEDTPA
jgi:hypothetical protein